MEYTELGKVKGYNFCCTNNIKKEDILKPGQGLYGWITSAEWEDFKNNGCPKDGIKYGQYGSESEYENKTPLVTTAVNFKGGIHKNSIIFVYHRSFNDINKNNPLITPLEIERILKKVNEPLRNKETKSTEVYKKISPSEYNSLVDKYLKLSINDISELFPELDKPRWYQELFINIYKNIFSIKNLFLLAFACGKGKSLAISLMLVDLYNKIEGDVFLLTTKPSTLDQYANQKLSTGYFYSKDILEKYHIEYLRDDINNGDFDYDKIKEQAGDKKIIFISSKQFLDRYLSSNSVDEKNKKLSKFNDSFKNTFKNKISLVISDEGHWGANTEITNKIHSNESIDDDIIGEIKSIFSKDVKILYSTATPSSLIFKYNLERSCQFYLDNEIEESFFDFLDNVNESNYNKFLDKISNDSDELREIISIFIEQYLQLN